MINDKSLEAVKEAQWSSHFCKPLYKTYCFSKIPGTLLHLLGEKSETLPSDCWEDRSYKSVILILIDGFGWKFFEKHHKNYPFLNQFVEDGIVSKLTSQFPSTTAAHITTLCTGMEVGQTGVFEWFYYEPLVNRVISPLLFSYAGDKTTETLDLTPDQILPEHTLFQRLKGKGISSYVFQSESIAHSPYSDWMFRGSESVPYHSFSHGLSQLGAYLPRGGLFYLYCGDIDAYAHRTGWESEKVKETCDSIFKELDRFSSKLPPGVACMVTADHGMTAISPKTTVFLNQEIPQVESMLLKGADGRPLTPAGSCRDYFLYVKDEQIDEAKELLQKTFEGKAEVFKTSTLIRDGFFGSKPVSETFLKRVGNLVILPYDHQSVWWYEKGRFEQRFYAMHGGLSRDELETIFLFRKT